MCNLTKCAIALAALMNGNVKCNEKNRFNVAFPTANPPHNHCTTDSPTNGTADAKFVITVAPHNDICPNGNTYPLNPVMIVNKNKITPDPHKCARGCAYDP